MRDLDSILPGGSAQLDVMLETTAKMLGDVLSFRVVEKVERGERTDANALAMNVRKTRRGDGSVKRETEFRIKYAKSFATLLKEETESFPTQPQLDQLDVIKNAVEYCQTTSGFCKMLQRLVREDPNAPFDFGNPSFARVRCMWQAWPFYKHDPTDPTLQVGEIAKRTSEELFDTTKTWLRRCDHLMCKVFNDYGDGEDEEQRNSAETEIKELYEFLAERIASHVTLEKGTSHSQSCISPNVLDMRARFELARNRMQSESDARTCLAALAALHKVARYGAGKQEARDIIMNQMHHLNYLMRVRPHELFSQGESQMDMKLLQQACRADVDFDVRCRVVDNWRAQNGAFTMVAAANAIERLKTWMEGKKSSFIEVVAEYDQTRFPSKNTTVMPPVPFGCGERFWMFVPHRVVGMRTGLSYIGRRVVRLTSLVWILSAYGEIRQGVVARRTLREITITTQQTADLVLDLLELKRAELNEGCQLLQLCQDMACYEGELSSEMTNAFSELSMFSCEEMMRVFSHTSPLSAHIMGRFSRLTRQAMKTKITPRYLMIAYDAMIVVLRVFKERRLLLSQSMAYLPNPVYEVLKTVTKVQQWSPLNGRLILYREDLKGASRMVEPLLRHLTERGILVRRQRAYIGNGKHATRAGYVFDSPTLANLLEDNVKCLPTE